MTTALNRLGAEGWELASMAPASTPFGHGAASYTLCAKRALP